MNILQNSRFSRRKIRLFLLAWALIILAPSEPQLKVEEERLSGPVWRLKLHRMEGVTLASASYLDGVGELTHVMNEFINALLEKVSFLATVVIESSLAEECTPPVGQQAARDQCPKAVEKYLKQQGGRHEGSSMAQLDKKVFDEREFKNVDVFIDAYNKGASQARKNGCKLFTMDVDAHDLPIESMEFCCREYGSCYGSCGKIKQNCDEDFRDCLRRMCKQNFDYKNATLLKQQGRLERRRAPLNGDVEPLALDLDPDDLDSALPDEPNAAEEDGDDEDKLYADLDREKRERPRRTTNSSTGEVTSTTAKRLKDKYKACKLASKLLIIGNLAFGCQHFKESQVRACCTSSANTSSQP